MKSERKLFAGQTKQKSVKISRVPDGTRIIVTSDQQIPFQDDTLNDVVYGEFARDFKPRTPGAEYHNFFNGDFADLYSLSRFPARVVKKFTLEDELDMVRERLDRWGRYFTHKHYGFGNHEARWDKHVHDQAQTLAESIPPLEEVLGLAERGYDWVPYGKHYEFEGFIIAHGERVVKYAAAAEYDLYHKSGTSGHVNRPQSYTFANASNGQPDAWYCTGMMCREDIGDFIKDWSRIQPWQQGFLIGEVWDGVLYVAEVRVHHGKFWANGKMYTVRGK